MSVGSRGPLVVEAGEGRGVEIGGLGVEFKVWGEATGGALSVVEHPMQPRRLVPPHVHDREDELSYVLEGRFGVRIGEFETEVGPGSYVYKPRGVLHTFWNPTDRPARLIELIVPAGFERFFEELADAFDRLVKGGGEVRAFEAKRAALGASFGLGFDSSFVDELKARHGLKLLGEP